MELLIFKGSIFDEAKNNIILASNGLSCAWISSIMAVISFFWENAIFAFIGSV
jgi:hypothetical protein